MAALMRGKEPAAGARDGAGARQVIEQRRSRSRGIDRQHAPCRGATGNDDDHHLEGTPRPGTIGKPPHEQARAAIQRDLLGRRIAEQGDRVGGGRRAGDEDIYALMAEKGTFLVPTSCVTAAMLADEAVAAAIPRHHHERYVSFEDVHHRNMALAKRIGVPIAMGTDAGTPGNHHGDNAQELVSMVHGCGFSPQEAIEAATMGGARLLRQQDNLGSIETGKLADVVGFAADPLADIRTVRNVRFVMKDGAVARNDF